MENEGIKSKKELHKRLVQIKNEHGYGYEDLEIYKKLVNCIDTFA
jgi:hypothetical protein